MLSLYGHFTASKAGISTLDDVKIDIDRVNKATGEVVAFVSNAVVTSPGSLSPLRNGLYRYAIANPDVRAYDYLGTFKTASASVDLKHVPSLRQEYVDSLTVTNGNVSVGTNNDKTGYALATPPATPDDVAEAATVIVGAVETRAAPSDVQEIVDGIEFPALDLGARGEKIDNILAKLQAAAPGNAPVLAVPNSGTPGMVNLAVSLRHGKVPVRNALVTVSMVEEGLVAVDGAYEVEKSYTGMTKDHTIDGVVHKGLALIEVFSSVKLKNAGYEGLYTVGAIGVERNVWVPEGGGALTLLGEVDPTPPAP
jgi:hypothetical protein